MDTARIVGLLAPFTAQAKLPPQMLSQLQHYLDLLLRWNARINLTAVRDPEQIVTRHFGESLFAARVLLGDSQVGQAFRPASNGLSHAEGPQPRNDLVKILADVGSGAGFPGIPMKLFAPELELTLIESHNKKATFLREVIRTLGLDRRRGVLRPRRAMGKKSRPCHPASCRAIRARITGSRRSSSPPAEGCACSIGARTDSKQRRRFSAQIGLGRSRMWCRKAQAEWSWWGVVHESAILLQFREEE